MKVPQFLPWVGQQEYAGMASCFEDNWITEGPKSEEFRDKLLKLINVKYGVFAPNGTLALYLALKSAGIGPGDEVLVPDFTFIGSANAVEMVGARPVFVDVNKRNFQLDVSILKSYLTENTKAIMPVHIYGTAVDMDAVVRFANQHKLLTIEDAAQAIGVHYKGQHAGTFGNVSAFSFFADKTITTGEGGFVVTNDEHIYENLLYLRNQGRMNRGTFIHPHIGYNFRMTDIQCAIGLVQLEKLDDIIKRKVSIKELYYELLSPLPEIHFFSPDPDSDWIPFRVAILCEKAHDLMAFMKTKEIECRTFFYPLHWQPCYSYLKKEKDKPKNLEDGSFPNSIYGYENGVCLPTFPSISEEQIRHVCSTIEEFYA